MVDIIYLENISKRYKDNELYSSVNEHFEKGDSVAFTGHNGCGKSTMLKIIGKLIMPTSGKVVYSDRFNVRYVTEKFEPVNCTARDFLMYMGRIGNSNDKYLKERIEKLSKDFFVSDYLDVNLKNMSKGTLQKIVVIHALLEVPDVLLLDEPLSGQDKESQNVFINKIKQIKDLGTTIFMSCHEERLINALSDKIYTIENGCVKRRDKISSDSYIILFKGGTDTDIYNKCVKTDEFYRLRVREKQVNSTIMELIQHGCEVRGLRNEKYN